MSCNILVEEDNSNLDFLEVGVEGNSTLETKTCLEAVGMDEENFIEDFSGCFWSSRLPEYPSWMSSFKETISDFVLQDITCLPDVPLMPSYEVMTSNIDEVVESTDNTVDVETLESSLICNCCLCDSPKFLVIPDQVICNATSMETVDHSSCPIVTLNNKKLVEGYFPNNNLSSNAAKMVTSVDEVRGNLRESFGMHVFM